MKKQMKRILSLVICLAMALSYVPLAASAAETTDQWDGSSVATSFAGGTGTKNDPYRIETAAQLIYFRNQVNANNAYEGKHIRLNADLDMADKTFGDAIGHQGKNYTSRYFNGHFDGNNHTISNLKITNASGYSALFGNVGFGTSESVISNLTLSGVNINRTSSTNGAAALVGNAGYLKIENCTVESGSIKSSGYMTAGIIASAAAGNATQLTVINCVNKAAITSTSTDSNGAGGIVGKGCENGTTIISECINYGDVTGKRYAAGIIGNAYASTVTQCANYGDISATGTTGTYATTAKAAGILTNGAKKAVSIENCYNVGKITSDGTTRNSAVMNAGGAAGIAAFNNTDGEGKTIKNCHNVGIVDGTNGYGYPIGLRQKKIENCYYLNESSKSNTTATKKTADEFADGTVYNLLQSANGTTQVWGQTIGTDNYPVFCNGGNEPQIVKKHAVSFDANGATGEKDPVKIPEGGEYTLPGNPFTPQSGYQFKGWATAADAAVIPDESITVTADTTLYAIWEKIPAQAPTVAVSNNLTLTYGEYTNQKFIATVEKKDGYTYEYQWIDGHVVISNTDTLIIPDDLATGEYDYYLAVGAKRSDNGEIAWYENRDILVKVNPKALSEANVALSDTEFIYNGDEQKPTVMVTVGGKVLTENTDYTLSWPSDCINAGEKTVTVEFKGNYSETVQKTYKIQQKEIRIRWGATEFMPYTGAKILPEVFAESLVTGDVCELTAEVVETTQGAGVIPGRWHAKVTALSNQNYCLPKNGELVTVEYGITEGYQDAPAVLGVNETVKGKADGKISGLTTAMEYATEHTADDDKYTKVTDADMAFAPGTYYVRYQAKQYYHASPFTEVTIGEGRKLTVMLPQNQVGYTLTVDKTEVEYMGGPTITLNIHEGYSKTDAFAVKINGADMQWGDYTEIGTQSCTEDIVITVQGVADITAPTAEIRVQDNKWTRFWNNLTCGLFFKESQDVTITAADTGSGVNSIEYFLSGWELKLDEVRGIVDWEGYNGAFKIDPNAQLVVYAKVTDNSGNTTFINSDGMILDDTVPTLGGIENGGVYYGDLTVTKEEQSVVVTLDGEPLGFAEGTYGYIPADNQQHTVTIRDLAGNENTYAITVYKKYTVTVPGRQEGYRLETDVTEAVHGEDVYISVALMDGYEKTPEFALKVNGKTVELTEFNNIVVTATEDMEITVEGIAPKTTEPGATEPEETEPEGTEPEATEPEETEPEETEPEATEPEATKPEETQPEPTEPKPETESPQTGDDFYADPWMLMMTVSVMGLMAVLLLNKKRETDE